MDPNGRIYRAPEDEIPAEDRARLDGYLRGREEAAKLALLQEEKILARCERLTESLSLEHAERRKVPDAPSDQSREGNAP